ncbi:WhiB family transcriptional regulator [Streptomyces sp. NPDC005486]|uniref:WhiB family transcriptional regulator n=1 Tax=Streptomyces sp. NPDC005486 TaxID=3155345 RepID=UPI00339E7122
MVEGCAAWRHRREWAGLGEKHHAADARCAKFFTLEDRRPGLVDLGVPGFAVEAAGPLPCRADPDAYFAAGTRPPVARLLCAGCGYVEACGVYAVGDSRLVGVWGGLTEGERRMLRRAVA